MADPIRARSTRAAATPLVPHGEPPAYFTFSSLTALGLPHATTTRHCPGTGPQPGPAPFTAETARALAPAGLDLARVGFGRQVHQASVARVGEGGGFAGKADGLVTTARRVPLAIFAADCLALLLYDPEAAVLGATHAGWRGTARAVAPATVAAMIALGARAERIRVAISPSIGPCCYEVDAPVIAALSSAYPDAWERWVTAGRSGHWMLDLWAANEVQLERAGVPGGHVENARRCTACHPDELYSYRKYSLGADAKGRLATLAALP
ncbi:MAG: peptidoglycan editing factor PgeF [Candidatus Rokubacteria bacterium]|nr:peptidoglycan editing factor PgeF [Candidatus Rokubacteria bacterium]MBI3825748.1 peptidoglycan editing factor PgeF [Candidatus Rokubacteria bacterium]